MGFWKLSTRHALKNLPSRSWWYGGIDLAQSMCRFLRCWTWLDLELHRLCVSSEYVAHQDGGSDMEITAHMFKSSQWLFSDVCLSVFDSATDLERWCMFLDYWPSNNQQALKESDNFSAQTSSILREIDDMIVLRRGPISGYTFPSFLFFYVIQAPSHAFISLHLPGLVWLGLWLASNDTVHLYMLPQVLIH